MTTTTILNDGRRLVINEDGLKVNRHKLNAEFVRTMDDLRGRWLKQSLAVYEAAINTPGFANGLNQEAKTDLATKQAELKGQYEAAALQNSGSFLRSPKPASGHFHSALAAAADPRQGRKPAGVAGVSLTGPTRLRTPLPRALQERQ